MQCFKSLHSSVEEEAQQAFGTDTILLTAGYFLTFLYFAVFLGKFNRKEHKVSTHCPSPCLNFLRSGLLSWEYYASD